MEASTNNIQSLAKDLACIKSKIQELKSAMDLQNAAASKIEVELLIEMERAGISKFSLEGVGTVYEIEKTSVKTPKLPEEKAAFFGYLESIGEFDALISVNSNSLNSWYKMKLEAAKERGEVFAPPGLELPSTYKQVGIRKS